MPPKMSGRKLELDERVTVSFSGWPLGLVLALDRLAEKNDLSRSMQMKRIAERDPDVSRMQNTIERENER
jgi:hypothetical protein